MTRNYGLQSKRGGLGGMSTAAPAYREGNPREYESHEPDDRELSAWMFVGLFVSPLFVGSAVLFYMAFVS
jgi:hypothetical protein